MAKKSALETIPGVGKSITADLESLGIREVSDLAGKDPEALYQRLKALAGGKMDRCVLYVFRCAVHFAENPKPADPELMKWWNWSDKKMRE